jgi:hypothetical protein
MTSASYLDGGSTTAGTVSPQLGWLELKGFLPDRYEGEATAKDSSRVVFVKMQYRGADALDISRSMGNDQNLEKSLKDKIYSKLFFPPHWEEEGVAKPNEAAKLGAFAVCKSLLETYGLIPDRIVPSIEGGVYISYTEKRDAVEKTLEVEVYNTSEVAALVNLDSERRILYSEDIRNMRFEKVMKVFKD